MSEVSIEWGVDYSDVVGRHVRDGWVKFDTREEAERFATKALDGRVMWRTVTGWQYAAMNTPAVPADPTETEPEEGQQ